MKKVFLLVFFLQIPLQADQINSGHNSIVFRPTLNMHNKKEGYLLEVLIPKSMSKKHITRSIIQQKISFNGFPIETKGYLNIFSSITIEELSDILFDLTFVKSSFKDGIVTGEYELNTPLNGQSVKVTFSTEPYVKIYQCPLPENITVKDKQLTGLVLIESVPACTALHMNQAFCKQYVTRSYCARSSLKASDKKGLYHQKSTYGQLHSDETDQHNGLMHFKIIEYNKSNKIYTYNLESLFADASIDSPFKGYNLILNNGELIIYSDKVSKTNRGFAIDVLNRPIDHNGVLIVPPCSGMTLEIINQNLLRVECTYGNNPDPFDNIRLERIIAHRINLEKSTLVDFATGRFFDCVEALEKNKKIEFSCTDKNGKQVPPPLILCKK
jgi:hypothetical protein